MKILTTYFTCLLVMLTMGSLAGEQKYESITLEKGNSVWYIKAGRDGDIRIGYGADNEGKIMKEIYSYEQFHRDVVEFMENMPSKKAGDPVVSMWLRPLGNQATTQDIVKAQVYPAAELWNALIEKLYPAIFTGEYYAERFNRFQHKTNRTPFIKITGDEKFPIFKIVPYPIGKYAGLNDREARVHHIMLSLAPEQRVALGHPAQYPPPVKTTPKTNARGPKQLDDKTDKGVNAPKAVNESSSEIVALNCNQKTLKILLSVLLLVLIVGAGLYILRKRANKG